MKIQWIVLFIGLIQFSGSAQPIYKTIQISRDIELIKLSENGYVHVSFLDLPNYGRTPANGLIFINGGEAFVFDSPWNDSFCQESVVNCGYQSDCRWGVLS
jgi:metallo-beta-lactamase class B